MRGHRLLATCQLQGVNPYTYPVDVLQRVDRHPARGVIELTPRVWKTRFADCPLRSDLERAVEMQVGRMDEAKTGHIGVMLLQ